MAPVCETMLKHPHMLEGETLGEVSQLQFVFRYIDDVT